MVRRDRVSYRVDARTVVRLEEPRLLAERRSHVAGAARQLVQTGDHPLQLGPVYRATVGFNCGAREDLRIAGSVDGCDDGSELLETRVRRASCR